MSSPRIPVVTGAPKKGFGTLLYNFVHDWFWTGVTLLFVACACWYFLGDYAKEGWHWAFGGKAKKEVNTEYVIRDNDDGSNKNQSDNPFAAALKKDKENEKDPNAELRQMMLELGKKVGTVTENHGKLKDEVTNIRDKVNSTSTTVEELKRDLPKQIQMAVQDGLKAQRQEIVHEFKQRPDGTTIPAEKLEMVARAAVEELEQGQRSRDALAEELGSRLVQYRQTLGIQPTLTIIDSKAK